MEKLKEKKCSKKDDIKMEYHGKLRITRQSSRIYDWDKSIPISYFLLSISMPMILDAPAVLAPSATFS